MSGMKEKYIILAAVWLGDARANLRLQLIFFVALCFLHVLWFLGAINLILMLVGLGAYGLFWIILNLVLSLKKKKVTGCAFVVGFIFITAGVMYSSYYYHENFDSDVIRNISVTQAVDFPQAGVFYFIDGKVYTQYFGQSLVSHSDEDSYYCVVPIARENWTVSDIVPLWAGCYTLQTPCEKAIQLAEDICISNWLKPVQKGARISSKDEDSLSDAKNDALLKRGLSEYPEGSPIIIWQDPKSVSVFWLDRANLFWAIPPIIWLLLTLIALPYRIATLYNAEKYAKIEYHI
eukprot:TRINITY_DN10835_c0_g1_i2.p1 TRINITY_DN10835_c0_g1~~TRINITY_DN10835_c0_g1_i2.p1  ORF type:complete len:291 (-),score=24.47 TRINITY_DN10835_c0_g1_i2:62-934(-)